MAAQHHTDRLELRFPSCGPGSIRKSVTTLIVMGISVRVQDYTGSTVADSTHPGIGALYQYAAVLKLPMFGYVDPFDDTWFNRSQMRLVIPELRSLLEIATEMEAEAARELVELAVHLDLKPHRYLIFNGD